MDQEGSREKGGPAPLTNTDANTLNKASAKPVCQYIQRKMKQDHVGFTSGIQGSVDIQNAIHGIHQISKFKMEKCDHFSECRRNHLTEFSIYSCWNLTANFLTLWISWPVSYLTSSIYKKTTANNIILTGEKSKAFSPRLETRQECLQSLIPSQCCTGDPRKFKRAKEKQKAYNFEMKKQTHSIPRPEENKRFCGP